MVKIHMKFTLNDKRILVNTVYNNINKILQKHLCLLCAFIKLILIVNIFKILNI